MTGNDPKGKECVFRLMAQTFTFKWGTKGGFLVPTIDTKCPGAVGCAQYLTDMGGPRCGLCR